MIDFNYLPSYFTDSPILKKTNDSVKKFFFAEQLIFGEDTYRHRFPYFFNHWLSIKHENNIFYSSLRIKKGPFSCEDLIKCQPDRMFNILEISVLDGVNKLKYQAIMRIFKYLVSPIYPLYVGIEIPFDDFQLAEEPVMNDLNYIKIFDFLNEKIDIKQVGIDAENAEDFLQVIKIYDQAIEFINNCSVNRINKAGSSYALRCEILRKSKINTALVFMKSLRPDNLNWDYLAKPQNYVCKRAELHTRMIAEYHVAAKSLSERLPNILLMRGNIGSGKTTAVRKWAQTIIAKGLSDDKLDELLRGVLTPDEFKYYLKTRDQVSNPRIYLEGRAITNAYSEKIVNDLELFYILDARHIFYADIKKLAIEPSKKRNRPSDILDFDVPLLTSFNRVLTRSFWGKDPCCEVKPIVDGYRDIRKHRRNVIEEIIKEPFIKDYRLFFMGKEVAKKVDGKWDVLDPELYAEACRIPTDEEIERDLKTIIDASSIDQAIARGDITESQRGFLEKWTGWTIEKALSAHAEGIAP